MRPRGPWRVYSWLVYLWSVKKQTFFSKPFFGLWWGCFVIFLFFFLLPFRFILLIFGGVLLSFLLGRGWASNSTFWFSLGFPTLSSVPCRRICLAQLLFKFQNLRLLLLVFIFLPLSFILLPLTRLMQFILLVICLKLLFRLLLIVTLLCTLSLFVLGMLIVSCTGVALARRNLSTVTL